MVKRSRVGTASTLAGDTDVINYVTTTQTPWQYCPAPMSNVQSGPSSGLRREVSRIFTVEAPENVEVRREGFEKIGELFEHCFYCKKKFKEKAEVFMYSEHAFCKTVCREIQMMVDTMKERLAAKRKMAE